MERVNEQHVLRARVLKCLHTLPRLPICTACLSSCVGVDKGVVYAALMTIGTLFERVEHAYTTCATCGQRRLAFSVIAPSRRPGPTGVREQSKRAMRERSGDPRLAE